jgi:hypothetical protein
MDIVMNFIPNMPHQFSASQEQSLDMLRANVQVGWTDMMKA